MRRDPRLEIITKALQQLIPGATPAFLSVEVKETLPGTASHGGEPHKHTWTGSPAVVAEHVFTRLYGRPNTPAWASPLEQAEDAKRRRDIVGEVGILMSAGAALESAPWAPSRPGDLVHVHYEAAGHMPAFGETYLVTAGAHGFLSMQLLAHTLPDTEDSAGMVGCFAVEDDPDPLTDLWFQAGPHQLTIVRDGRPVHIGGAR